MRQKGGSKNDHNRKRGDPQICIIDPKRVQKLPIPKRAQKIPMGPQGISLAYLAYLGKIGSKTQPKIAILRKSQKSLQIAPQPTQSNLNV